MADVLDAELVHAQRAVQVAKLRFLESVLVSRAQIASAAGLTFDGDRDLYAAFGWKRALGPEDFHARFRRNGIARRVVKAFPDATWRGQGGELVEDEDPGIVTQFEDAWFRLQDRLKVWSIFRRADYLAGLGRFSVILIGAPGRLEDPLPDRMNEKDVLFLEPYDERYAEVTEYDTDPASPRHGSPTQYSIKTANLAVAGSAGATSTIANRVHYSRVLHIAEPFDNRVFGVPRLEAVWNDLDNLEKITGAGSEAFYQRAHPGTQFDIDKDMAFREGEEERFSEQIDEFIDGFRRDFKTRGVKVNQFRADVANFDRNFDSIIASIAAGAEIPQRILLGSERGQLASEQDRENWQERVQDRRNEYAGPNVVRPFADLMIRLQVLPTPREYDVRWPEIHDRSEDQRADFAVKMSVVNKNNAPNVVFEPDEIRDRSFGMEPLNRPLVESTPGAPPSEDNNEEIVAASAAARRQPSKYVTWVRNGRRPVNHRQ